MSESRDTRATYDQRRQSTFKELVAQREQHQREILALHTRLTAATKELAWHNYVEFLLFALALLCFASIFFTRPRPMQRITNKVPGASSRAGLIRSAAAPFARKRMPATLMRQRIRRSTPELEQMDTGALQMIHVTPARRMKDNRRVRLEQPMSLTDMDDEDDPEDSPADDLLMDIDD